MKSYLEIRKSLMEQKGLGLYDSEELKYLDRPIGRAVYLNDDKPTKEDTLLDGANSDIEGKHWSDRLECKICGGNYLRANRSKHNKTQKHMIYVNVHDKMKKIMLEE